MNFKIRDVIADDLSALTGIYRESVENGTSSYELAPPDISEMTRRYKANSEQGYPYILAEDDGAVLGYAYAGPFRTRPAYRWLVEDSIYLAPEARGRGIGYQLLQELVERCEHLGFRQMVAVIGGASEASIALHRKAGFKDAGIMKATGFKHGKWLDTVTMQIELGEGANAPPDMQSYPGNLYSE